MTFSKDFLGILGDMSGTLRKEKNINNIMSINFELPWLLHFFLGILGGYSGILKTLGNLKKLPMG
jgi:hypothetical protein